MQGLPQSRWSLLAIPPTTTEEIALVPCDGCDKNPHLVKLVQELEQNKTPHLSCVHTLPALVFNKGPGTQHRYEQAQARISVAGCAENCPKKLLTSFKAPDREVILSPNNPLESQLRTIEDAINTYTALLPQSPQTPVFMMPAAQAPRRKRFVKPQPKEAQAAPAPVARATFAPQASQPKPIAIQPTLQAPATASFSAPAPGGLFQAQAQQAKRGPWLPLLFLLLLAGGGTWWYLQPPSPDKTPDKEKQGSLTQQATPRREVQAPNPAPERVPPSRAQEPRPIPKKSEPKPVTPQPRPAPVEPVRQEPPKPRAPKIDQAHLMRSKMINQGWIGGFCRTQQQCGYNKPICLPVAQEGYCTRYCLSWCPRPKSPFHAASSCIRADALQSHVENLPFSKGGLCMTHCDFKLFPKHGCRVGTRCMELALSRRAKKTQSVCVPTKPTPPEETP
ncbi:MAG: hypothetical protein H6728_15090 [Myxococcales bacterium]|nr:hypothetical protein [Myxococcales bacterium]